MTLNTTTKVNLYNLQAKELVQVFAIGLPTIFVTNRKHWEFILATLLGHITLASIVEEKLGKEQKRPVCRMLLAKSCIPVRVSNIFPQIRERVDLHVHCILI